MQSIVGFEQERKILKMPVEGHHYKTAACELGISKSTVSFHLKNIYEKLQVHSKTEAVAKVLREKSFKILTNLCIYTVILFFSPN